MTGGRLFQAGGYTQSKSVTRLLFNIWNKCLSSGYTQSKSMVRLQEPPKRAPSGFSPEMSANLA